MRFRMFNYKDSCSRRFPKNVRVVDGEGKVRGSAPLVSAKSILSFALTLSSVFLMGLSFSSEAKAQVVVKDFGGGIVKRVEAHDPTPCVEGACKLRLAFIAPGKATPNLSRVNLKLGNRSYNSSSLIKASCRQASSANRPFVVAKRAVVIDPSCLNVSTKKLNRKNTGQLDMAKFLASLTQLRASLVSSGVSAASADQLIDLIRSIVNGSLVTATVTPVTTAPPVVTAAPPVVTVAPPVVTTTPISSSVVPSGPQCSGTRVDNTNYPCRDGNMYSVIYYPLGCDYSARPLCPVGYSEVHRACLSNGQCQVNCRKSCGACGAGEFKDDTSTYQCNGSVQYTIRYHPFTCQATCPAGFVSDFAGCKDSGECQINCKRSCAGAPVPVPSTTVTAVPSITVTTPPVVTLPPIVTLTRTVTPSVTTTVAAPTVINRCDSQYVLVNGACKFGVRANMCIAASLTNLNAPDPTTLCMNQSGTMIPFKGCEDGPNLGRNCATGQARDQRCSEADYRDHPYITSFNTPREIQPGFFGVYCCSQPTVGGAQPPSPGVSCRLVSAEDKYDHSFTVQDPSKLQPNQRIDCSSGGEASAMKNCGVTPTNAYGNGTCGYNGIFGATKAMSAPVVNHGQCCSGRANYVRHIIGGNGDEGRKGEHAYYICCGADGEPECNG